MSSRKLEFDEILVDMKRYKRKLRKVREISDPIKRDLLTKIYELKIESQKVKLKIFRLTVCHRG